MKHNIDPSKTNTLLTNLDDASSAVAIFAINHFDEVVDFAVLAELSVYLRNLDWAFAAAVDHRIPGPIAHAHIRDAVSLTTLLEEAVDTWLDANHSLARLYAPYFECAH